MSVKKIGDFFKNKVTIELKTGHRFEGLLSKVDYKNNTVVLQNIEHLDHAYNKEQIVYDAKIAEKAFQADSIQEILFKNYHFCEPKKYNPDDFFDSMTEEATKNFEKGEYKGGRGRGKHEHYKGGNKYEKDQKNRDYRPKKKYEEKGKYSKREQEDDRDYR